MPRSGDSHKKGKAAQLVTEPGPADSELLKPHANSVHEGGVGASPQELLPEDTISHPGPGADQAVFDQVAPNLRPTSMRDRAQPAAAAPTGDDAWANFDDASGQWLDQSQSGVGPIEPGPSTEHTSASVVAPPPSQPLRLQPLGVPTMGPGIPPSEVAQAVASPSTSPLGHFLGLDGRYAGQRFAVTSAAMRIGRAARNDLVIDDPSMSREHARLEHGPEGFVLSDANSGNGTFIAGQRLARAQLNFGDDVTFGAVRFRFLHPAAPLEPSPAQAAAMQMSMDGSSEPTAGRPGKLGWALALCFVGAAVGGGFGLHRWQQRQREVSHEVLFATYLAGVRQFGEHHFAAADDRLNEVLAMEPGHLRARQYKKALGREKLAQQQLIEARDFLKTNDLARAYASASGMTDSTFRAQAQQIMHDIDSELDVRVARAQAAVDAGQVTQAQKLVQVVEAVHPGRADVAALLVRANLQTVTPHLAPSSIASRAAARRRSVGTLPGQAGDALRSFVSGDVATAIQMLENVNSEEGASLRAKLEKFVGAYETGLGEHRAKRAQNAIAALSQAKRLEMSVSGGTSHLVADINHKLADMHYVLGTEALLGGKLPQAYEAFHNGIVLYPEHTLCVRQLTELVSRAQAMLEESKLSSDKQKIRTDLHTVMEMVPADSDLHRRAKARLEALP